MSPPSPVVVTRFAPSPSGLLHLGHAHAALFAWHRARSAGGRFFLRIEDIDQGRSRPEFETAILDDLAWLGLDWDDSPWRQSERMASYAKALASLEGDGLLYPCFCTRRDIQREIAAAAQAPHGPDGPLYPGTCRKLSNEERRRRMERGDAYALRLDMVRATAAAGPLDWADRAQGPQQARPEHFGDVVLARKEVATSYHLAVVVDDAAQGVSLVTRGRDLFAASHIHRLLQALLDLPVPQWEHHDLICDPQGRRLAKRDDAESLRNLKEAGFSPADVRACAGFPEAI